MRFWLRHVCFLLAAAGASEAPAEALFVAPEKKVAFCSQLLERLSENEGNESASDALMHIGAKIPTFTGGLITFQIDPSGPEMTEGVGYTSFDIDNDGVNEILLKYQTSFHGTYGDLLWIVPRTTSEKEFSKNPHFSSKEFSSLDAIESTPSWPYDGRGLRFVEIIPFELNSVNYLSLKDTLFGDPKFRNRSWVIAKFSGHKLDTSAIRWYSAWGHKTDNFQTVCSFRKMGK